MRARALEAEHAAARFRDIIGGAVVTWPMGARAARSDAARRHTPTRRRERRRFQARIGAFQQGLALLGWNIGRNVRIEVRWATTNAGELRRQAAELVALAPDVILSGGTSTCGSIVAGDQHRADCVRARHRPGRHRHGR